MQSPTLEPNWVVADDFRDPFEEPVRTVKLVGLLQPSARRVPTNAYRRIPVLPGPGVEDGYVISFFRDVPVGPNNTFTAIRTSCSGPMCSRWKR